MKKRWIFALIAGAVAVAAGAVVVARKGKGKRVECCPEGNCICGDDLMREECGYDMDNPTILHNRVRV